MFDFTKETIINSLKLEEGIDRIASITGKTFRVLRCADYSKEFLASKVFKTAGRVGKVATATFTVPTVNGLYKVDINLKLTDKYMSDYASAVYKFQKPVIVEFELFGTDNAIKMAKAIRLAIPENYQFLKVDVVNGKVLVKCTDPAQFFETATLSTYKENTVLPSEGVYVFHSKADIVKNVTSFATGEWLMENLRFPSYPNVRYNAVNSDEYPISGSIYTQYSFQYSVLRKGLSGLGTVGQSLQSVTTHVFYVLSSLVADFETKLVDAFGQDVIKEIDSDVVYTMTILPAQVDNDGVEHSMSATIAPSTGFTPAFTYSLVAPVTGITLTNTGGVTAESTVAVGTKFEVKVKETNTLTESIKEVEVI